MFEKSYLLDMAVVSNATHDRKHADTALEQYGMNKSAFLSFDLTFILIPATL